MRELIMLQKITASWDAPEVLRAAMSLFGGHGVMEDFSCLPRLYRDAAVNELWEGPRNVLLTQIHRDLQKAAAWYPPAAFVRGVLAGAPAERVEELAAEIEALVAHPSLLDPTPATVDVCRRWDAFYRYLPDQQSLFAEAFTLGTREIIERADRRIGAGRIAGLRDFARLYVAFLLENDHYFRMMTHFMLDGRISGRPLEKLNRAARSVLDQFDRVMAQRGGPDGDRRLTAHAFFAALNGVLISFRQCPGRTPEDVRTHMEKLSDLLAEGFEPACGCAGSATGEEKSPRRAQRGRTATK